MKWTKVTDGLPTVNSRVITCRKNNKLTFAYYLDLMEDWKIKEHGFVFDDQCCDSQDVIINDVIAWMPEPKTHDKDKE